MKNVKFKLIHACFFRKISLSILETSQYFYAYKFFFCQVFSLLFSISHKIWLAYFLYILIIYLINFDYFGKNYFLPYTWLTVVKSFQTTILRTKSILTG